MTETKNNNKKKRKPYGLPRYKDGQTVYLTAFLKKLKGKFFMCRALIEECPEPNSRRVYKVRITAVADAAVGHEVTVPQASLLGRTITKRENEISSDIPDFMRPKTWIEIDPNAQVETEGQET